MANIPGLRHVRREDKRSHVIRRAVCCTSAPLAYSFCLSHMHSPITRGSTVLAPPFHMLIPDPPNRPPPISGYHVPLTQTNLQTRNQKWDEGQSPLTPVPSLDGDARRGAGQLHKLRQSLPTHAHLVRWSLHEVVGRARCVVARDD